MKNWSRVPDRRLTPRRPGRLTVGRNVTSTSRVGPEPIKEYTDRIQVSESELAS
jgi:hypothetical protein